jgi:hypothetical protein
MEAADSDNCLEPQGCAHTENSTRLIVSVGLTLRISESCLRPTPLGEVGRESGAKLRPALVG